MRASRTTRGPTGSSSASSPTWRRSSRPGATRTGPADGAARSVGRGLVHPGVAARGRGRDRRCRKTAQVGDELFGLAAVLRSEPSLRRVLTDVDRRGQAREGLVRQVFGGQGRRRSRSTSWSTRRPQRWTAGRDFVDALEHLGAVAVVRSAADDAGRLADELFRWPRSLNDNPDLRDAIARPRASRSDRQGAARRLLAGKVAGRHLAPGRPVAGRLLPHRRRRRSLDYQKVAADVHGERVATVRSARALDRRPSWPGSRRRSTAQYGREVHLNVARRPRGHRRHPGRDRRRRHRRHRRQPPRRRTTHGWPAESTRAPPTSRARHRRREQERR